KTISSSKTTSRAVDPEREAAARRPSTAQTAGRMETNQRGTKRVSVWVRSAEREGKSAANEPSVGRRKPRATPRRTHERPKTTMSVRPSVETAAPEGVPGLLSVLTAILTLRNWLCETGIQSYQTGT